MGLTSDRKLRLGLMGGTFDPIHIGHLVTAEAARDQFSLDEVVFIPSGNPPHKRERVVTEASERLMMCILATVTNPFFKVSAMEINREGYSYTYETVSSFQEMYDNNCEIFFITGSDAVLEIFSWKNIDLLMDKCTFIAASRPGFMLNEGKEEKLTRFLNKKLYFMEVPALSISSTDIRNRVANNNTIKYLVPDTVEKYIEKRGLYRKKTVGQGHNEIRAARSKDVCK